MLQFCRSVLVVVAVVVVVVGCCWGYNTTTVGITFTPAAFVQMLGSS